MANVKENDLWGIYLLECADGTYYCGITNNITQRLTAHQDRRGAKYTRGRLPVTLLTYSGDHFSHGDALRHERAVKRLPRIKKIVYIKELVNELP